MKIMSADFKKGRVHFRIDSPDDTWHLYKLIKQGDLLLGKAERKIKLGSSEEKAKVVKKTFTVEISVEKASIEGTELRVNGLVREEKEDIPKGSHQGITLAIGEEATLTKESWGLIERKRLQQAAEEKPLNILAVVFDREEATFARLTQKGFEIIMREKGDVSKKGYTEGKENFFSNLAKAINEQSRQLNPSKIILASPAFWKEYLSKELSEELKKKCILATVSSTDNTAFSELSKRPELEETLKQDRAVQEDKAIDEALSEIRKGRGCYGMKHLEEAADSGNLRKILVNENLLELTADANHRGWVEALLERAESVGAEISIISNEQAQKKLAAFNGILGIQRWQTNESNN